MKRQKIQDHETNDKRIKVGFCVAYDWSLLQYSLPLIYDDSDLICLSIDQDRMSWTGVPYSWDETGFQNLISSIDSQGKIKILEENYHLPDLSPMQNEVRQRNRIAKFFGDGGWYIQLDTDEFFLNFKGFVGYLKALRPARKINVACPWITLYKQSTEGFFYVDAERFDQIEFMQIATKWPTYEYGRRNGNFNLYTDFAILHLSWARSEDEIWEKLNNWGHRDDFDIRQYFEQWQLLNVDNYRQYQNIHHLKPEAWPALGFIPAKSINELLGLEPVPIRLPILPSDLKQRNNIWLSRLASISRRLGIRH